MPKKLLIRRADSLISVAEAAQRRGVSKAAIHQAFQNGSLPGAYVNGKCLLVDANYVLDYRYRRGPRRENGSQSQLHGKGDGHDGADGGDEQ